MRLIRLNNLIFIALFQILLRYRVIIPLLREQGIVPALTDCQFAMLVLATVAIAASGNAINDYFDIATDKINRPERQVVGTTLDRRYALLVHVVLTLVGIFVGLYLAFVMRRELYALIFVGVPIVLWLYSTHFKRLMFIGNLVVAALVSLTAYLVVSVEFTALTGELGAQVAENQACRSAWLYSTAYALFALATNLGREIIKDIEDVEGDAACGCRTLPVEMGVSYSKSVAVMVQVVIVAMTWAAFAVVERLQTPVMTAYLALTITLPTLAICVVVMRGRERKDFHRASQICKIVMAAGVLACLIS